MISVRKYLRVSSRSLFEVMADMSYIRSLVRKLKLVRFVTPIVASFENRSLAKLGSYSVRGIGDGALEYECGGTIRRRSGLTPAHFEL